MDRCKWVTSEQIYIDYHDNEWGVPQYDSRALWEKLILEGFQSGLSWITILKKREAFRKAFQGFEPSIIATWGQDDVNRLLQDTGIVRHRGKIEATINNARIYLKQAEEMSFSDRMWAYVGGSPIIGHYETVQDIPTQSPLSVQIAKDLKKAGYKFCGPTTVYAWMQSCGLLDEHTQDCWRRHA